MFQKLRAEYDSRPNEDSIQPHQLTGDGYIDADISLPVTFVADNLPQLRVRVLCVSVCLCVYMGVHGVYVLHVNVHVHDFM